MSKRLKISMWFLIFSGFFAAGYGAPGYGIAALILALSIWTGVDILETFRKFESVNKSTEVSLQAFIAAAFAAKAVMFGVWIPLLFFLNVYEALNKTILAALMSVAVALIIGASHFFRHWIFRKEILLTFWFLRVKVNENQIAAVMK